MDRDEKDVGFIDDFFHDIKDTMNISFVTSL